MKRNVIVTKDGSHTIQLGDSKEHYHSTHGAIQESEHIFIKQGLEQLDKELKDVQIFEVGFGTGLNAFLTYLHAKDKGVFVNYTGIEAFPLEKEIYKELNYHSELEAGEGEQIFSLIHESEWGNTFFLSPDFALTKVKSKLEDFYLLNKYHLIYFDAFDPEYQPELWTAEMFEKMYAMLEPGGILVTYSAKGKVRRALKKAGFLVEKLPGPPGKREMTRAIKL